MGIIVGKTIAAAAPGQVSAADAAKLFGFDMSDWKEILDRVIMIMRLRQGNPEADPAPAPRLESARPGMNPPAIIQAPAPNKADRILTELERALGALVAAGGGGAKIFDTLKESNLTIGQVHELLAKAIK